MALLERLSKNIQLKAWEGEFPVRYLYTYGVAAEKFFRNIKDRGSITGIRCPRCNLIYVPPNIFCERCFDRLEEWVDVDPKGKLYSFTVCHLTRDGSRREDPSIIGIIKIDGTEGALIHRLGEVEKKELKIGMTMEAVLKNSKEREGSILDILYFRPVR